MFLIFLINALMGATFSIVKLILDNYTDPFFLVGYRMTLAGFLLLTYLAITNQAKLKINKSDISTFFKIILAHVYFSYLCEFISQQYIGPAKVALLFNLSPFITALLSYLLYQQKQSFKKVIYLIVGFIGFLPVLLTHEVSESLLGSLFLISWPELILLFSICSAVYGWLIVEHLVVKRHYSILMVNGYAMFGGGLLAIVTSFVVGNYGQFFGLPNLARAWNPVPFNDFYALTGWILLLILFSNFIYYNVYGWLMYRYSVTLLAFSGLTIPLFASLWEWLIFGIATTWSFWLSLGIISFGLALYYRQEYLEQR